LFRSPVVPRILVGRTVNFHRRSTSILALTLALGAPSLANASESAPSQTAPAAEQTSEGGIIVTGSRIARSDLESAMPVSVVAMAEAEALGRNRVYDALMRDPVVSPGIGLANSFGQAYDGGTSSISLRNLGTNRSLTLIDGRRRVSGSARSSAVDLNMIPSAMVERIEIITGGAAAIYGADAVTGAVNVITKKTVEGIQLSANTGISKYGDGRETTISAATGGKFAGGRGSFSIGGTFNDTAMIRHRDRKFSQGRILYLNNPQNRGGSDGVTDQLINYDVQEFFYANQPTFFLGGQSYMYENGSIRVPTYDKQWTSGQYSIGEGGDSRNLQEWDFLRGPLTSAAAMARIDFELTDAIAYRGKFEYGHSKYDGATYPYRDDQRSIFFNGLGGSVAYLDNPYLPTSIRDIMVANGRTSLNIDRTYANWPVMGDQHKRTSYTLFNSLEGKLGNGLRWEAFHQFGRTIDNVVGANIPYKSRWTAARDAVRDPVSGDIVCRDPAARAAGCVPFDIFSTDAPSHAQRDWALHDRIERRQNTQNIFGANIVGELFQLPYGAISAAFGVEHRRESLKTVDDPLAAAGEVVYTGAQTGLHPDLDVSMNVSEVYGEVVIPLLRDLPFARHLEIEAAYRYSDYSTVGATDTWKVGATWAPFDGITFRGVRSRSVRTPNFGELYEPQRSSISGTVNDPCTDAYYYFSETRSANCAALGISTPLEYYKEGPVVTSGGNTELKPETSNSLTLGVVLQPRFLRGLDVTVDYWNIDIKGVIAQFGTVKMMELCVDLPTIDNVFCQNIGRGGDGRATSVSTQSINAQRMLARGVDLGVNWRTRLGAGQLSLGLKGSWLIKHVIETTPGIAAGDVVYDGGYANPRFRGTMFVSYSDQDWSLGFDTRFLSASKYDPAARSAEYYADNTVPHRIYNDLSVRRRIEDTFELGFGVNNLFDVKPPMYPGAYFGGGGRYDTIGRYFHLTGKITL